MKSIGQRLGTAPQRLRTPPKAADPHYATAEHRRWAAEVIRRAGGMCQECGTPGGRLYADHVVELRDGGSAVDPRNGRALCARCHARKTAAVRRARHDGSNG